MLHALVVTLTCVVAILLIIVVLMQSSKGGGLAGAFGAAGATQILGVRRTADFLSKATTVLAALFMALCVVAEFTTGSSSGESGESVIQKNAPKQSAPVSPVLPQSSPEQK
ncbi:MAG: preprotein translocase subunit SecG [Chloroherpetonaceae bacterium]|nr:preprotein translocase subunit SecG [Chloroherpetonaceae bacterium]MDW8437703.1 preprotein translocase subunit SecG [Chloroherpetonaceae bacterium]